MTYRHSHGFTLLELMLALAIFAMLATAGWQVMDSLTKSRDRAKLQIDQLSELQYAYLQLSQDFAQTVNYVVMPTNLSKANLQQNPPEPTFTLNQQHVKFIRFANPDPRLNVSPVLAKIEYQIIDGKLIKNRYYQLQPNQQEIPVSTVLLTNIDNAQWSALTPETVNRFPDNETLRKIQEENQKNQEENAQSAQNNVQNSNKQPSYDLANYQQLPKAVTLQFNYHQQPIIWRFTIPPQPPTKVAQNTTKPTNNNNNNQNNQTPNQGAN